VGDLEDSFLMAVIRGSGYIASDENINMVASEVITAVVIKGYILCDVTTGRILRIKRGSGGKYRLRLQSWRVKVKQYTNTKKA
jgi:hypothetical protein